MMPLIPYPRPPPRRTDNGEASLLRRLSLPLPLTGT